VNWVFFPKSKRIEVSEFINYEPGPGSYNIKKSDNVKGFLITHAKDSDSITKKSSNMGPGKYMVNHSLQDKRIQSFNYDNYTKKTSSKMSTINFLREKYQASNNKSDKKSKSELRKLLNDSILKHANRTV